MNEVEMIWEYILAIVPSITAILSVMASVLIMIKKIKGIFQDTADDTKAMKKDYKELNKALKIMLEENKQLKATLTEFKDEFTKIENKVEDLTNVEKERVQQESELQDMDSTNI